MSSFSGYVVVTAQKSERRAFTLTSSGPSFQFIHFVDKVHDPPVGFMAMNENASPMAFRTTRRLAAALCCAAMCASATSALAQTYPAKPIRMIVPVPPGGGSDAIARVVADRMAKAMGQTFIVENKPGAGGLIGSDAVAKAAPDGYTVLMINNAFVINPWIYKLPYNAQKDFAPITILATSPNVLVAHPSFPANSVPELIAFARRQPGAVSVAVSSGQMSHLGSALLEQAAGIKLQLVPYKGAGAGNIDLLAGTVSLSFGTAPTYVAQIKAGKLKALGVGGAAGIPSLPGVPPIADTLPGFEANTWFGLFAPAGTPRPIIDRLRKEVMAAMATPEVTERMASDGYLAGAGATPEQFAAQIKQELAQWEAVVKKGDIKAD
jgi:tripartite-type tricarboxylate transporter receptor subunit TctC